MSLVAGTAVDHTGRNRPELVRFPGPGLVSRVLAALLVTFVRPVISLFARFPDARWPFALVDGAAIVLPRPRKVHRRTVALPSCRAELIKPRSVADSGIAILYLHGGGFITCGLHTHRRLAADIAHAAERPALAVCYRQLPRHGLGEALEDAVDGFRALIAQGYSAENISVVGDSAGGYLAVATALAVARAGLGRPHALALMSPMTWVDPDFPVDDDADDPLLTGSTIRAISRKLAAVAAQPVAELPPVRLASADLRQLPPTLIQVGTREVLYDGAQELADRIAAAGVPCQLQVWEGQFHVFQAAALLMAPARAAVAEIGAFLRSVEVKRGVCR